MTEKKIINLRQARKSKQRIEKRKQGDDNALKFGQTKAETKFNQARKTLDNDRLDGHKLDE